MNENDNAEQNGRSMPTEKTKDPKPGKVPIYIDGTKYHHEGHQLTGAQLRTVPSPPVSSDRSAITCGTTCCGCSGRRT